MFIILLSLDLMLIGIFTLIFITMHSFVGIWIIVRYFKYKDINLLLIGIGWIGAATVWIGVVVDFVCILLFNVPTPIEVHLLIIGGALPFTQLAWVAAITNMMSIEKSTRKKILIIGAIIAIIFCPIYISMVFINPSILGEKITPIQVKLSTFNQIHYAIEILVFILPGLWLSKDSLRTNDPKIRLKGKILLITFLISILMTLLELLSSTVLVYLIARIVAMVVSVLFYIGFILPNWAKKFFLKEK